jgi:SRSO17 transposase
MTVEQIRSLGPQLMLFLEEFDDCFIDIDTRFHLKEYVKGQLSDLPRKSVEPIALRMDVPPRTLQEFLSLSHWDQDRLRDTMQKRIGRDHGGDQAIGIVDESGHPKKGDKTACVNRQYCGASGKIDNCVMSVHLCYASFDGSFRAMIDSNLYLPKDWNQDTERRRQAGIPDEVVYRPKHHIALEQVSRSIENGLRLGWIVADEWYGEKPLFIAGLEALGQRFVLEIPKNLMGWLYEPSEVNADRSEVQHLVRWSGPMLKQEWTELHIKDTNLGAMVWEVRAAPFWMKRDKQIVGPYWLIAARDRLDQDTIKYFLSNAKAGVPLEAIVHVAFSRWPVERCIEDEKSELGLSHFECRKYTAVLRHLRITQLSHLFLAEQSLRLRGEKSADHDLPDQRCQQRTVGRVATARGGSGDSIKQGRADHRGHTDTQRLIRRLSRQGQARAIAGAEHPCRNAPLLHSPARRVAL